MMMRNLKKPVIFNVEVGIRKEIENKRLGHQWNY